MRQLSLLILVLLLSGTASAEGSRETGDFEGSGITKVVVEGETFDVEVDAVRGRSVSMTVQNRPDSYTVYHSITDSTLTVWVESRFSIFQRRHNGALVFAVPSDTEFEVDNSTGNVSIVGLSPDDITIETTTGDIVVQSVESEIDVESTTGDIRVGLITGDLSVSSTTGDVTIQDINGDIEVRTTTGDQTISRTIGDLEIRSTTGDVTLTDIEAEITARTTTGDMAGSGILLTDDSQFEASTGRVELDLINRIEDLEFDLTSTTGSLRVGDERSQRQLFLGGTGIRVEGKTSTGHQTYF